MSRLRAMIAATSKYSHQSAETTAIPSAAAAITPASNSKPAPRPMAMSDSPRAIRMISAYRSAKCSGATRQLCPPPITAGPR